MKSLRPRLLCVAVLFALFYQSCLAAASDAEPTSTRRYHTFGAHFGGFADPLLEDMRFIGGPAFLRYLRTVKFWDLPEGLDLVYDQKTASLYVTGNQKELTAFEKNLHVIDGPSAWSTQVRCTLRVIEFEAGKVDKLDRQHPSGLDGETIIKLWKAGEGKTVHIELLSSVSSVAAEGESGKAVIFPTEDPWTPSYDTQRDGVVSKLVPVVNTDNKTINLGSTFRKNTYAGNRADVPKALQPFCPIFRKMEVSNQTILFDGATTLLGSVRTRDGKHEHFLLVSASVGRADGHPIRGKKSADRWKLIVEESKKLKVDEKRIDSAKPPLWQERFSNTRKGERE